MNLGLAGKAAIITGASAGIGFACSQALFEEGASIVMVARDPERKQRPRSFRVILKGKLRALSR